MLSKYKRRTYVFRLWCAQVTLKAEDKVSQSSCLSLSALVLKSCPGASGSLDAYCTNSIPVTIFQPPVFIHLKYYLEKRSVRCQRAFGVSWFILNQYSLGELSDLFLCVLPTRLSVHTYAFVIYYVSSVSGREREALGFSGDIVAFSS